MVGVETEVWLGSESRFWTNIPLGMISNSLMWLPFPPLLSDEVSFGNENSLLPFNFIGSMERLLDYALNF